MSSCPRSIPDTVPSLPTAFQDDAVPRTRPHPRCRPLTHSFVQIHADELHSTLVWHAAALSVLHVLPARTVAEGMVIPSEVHLGRQVRGAVRCGDSYSGVAGVLVPHLHIGGGDVDVLRIDVCVHVLVFVNVFQHVQLK